MKARNMRRKGSTLIAAIVCATVLVMVLGAQSSLMVSQARQGALELRRAQADAALQSAAAWAGRNELPGAASPRVLDASTLVEGAKLALTASSGEDQTKEVSAEVEIPARPGAIRLQRRWSR